MMRIGLTALACGLFLTGSVAHGEITASDYLMKTGAERDTLKTYLYVTENRFGWVNADLKNSGKDMLYGAPTRIVLEREDLDSILHRYVDDHPSTGKFPTAAILLVALKDAFPCPPK